MSDVASTMSAALRSMGTWLSQQRNLLDQSTYESVRKTQKQTLTQNIGQMPTLTPEQATDMTRAINEGPWTNEEKAEFATTISDVMARKAVSGSLTRRPNQNMRTFHKYLSRADIELLADSSRSLADKLDQIACRLVKIRLWLPSEQCVKNVMKACLVAGLKLDASNHVPFIKSLKQSLKKKIASQPKDIVLPNPMPDDPRHLPQEIFQDAYDVLDPPVDVSEGLCMTMDVASRTTNSSSGSTTMSTALALPSSSSKKHAAIPSGVDFQTMVMSMCQAMQANVGKRHDGNLLNNFQLLTPNFHKRTSPTSSPSSVKAVKLTQDLQNEMPQESSAQDTEQVETAKNPAVSLFVGPPIEDDSANAKEYIGFRV